MSSTTQKNISDETAVDFTGKQKLRRSNNYFKFKQFTIYQDKCAMKVCTDSCLFGALLPTDSNLKTALDIGTGTGLLSLMLAQKNAAVHIDAVEIDADAYDQAKQNLCQSLWANRVNILHQNINDFKSPTQYDLIFSNPPFYDADLKTNNPQKNLAMHATQLSLVQLLTVVQKLLNPNGLFYVLIPHSKEQSFIATAQLHNLFCQKITRVKQTLAHNYFRSIMAFSLLQQQIKIDELAIKNNQQYTPEFVALLKEFYLIF